eukprot:NODE_6739_length_504_cov_17.119363_g6573_i0.p1 GENE.NODE_6739_length_504_cov_17.119363_g6573_i0~~NODE_6739_length_504_cov_17.119363_g6573_i0.p1  ORF type:complete len:130 (+),score=21.08 NODE_6739_length_504_cov_17.119363_g6573_i0:52-390(+)
MLVSPVFNSFSVPAPNTLQYPQSTFPSQSHRQQPLATYTPQPDLRPHPFGALAVPMVTPGPLAFNPLDNVPDAPLMKRVRPLQESDFYQPLANKRFDKLTERGLKAKRKSKK